MAHAPFSLGAALAVAALAASSPSSQAKSGPFTPWAYSCHFGRYGAARIDGTSRQQVTLTLEGKTYRVTGGGSYFFSTEEGPVVFFGPGQKWFEYKGVRDDHCVSTPAPPPRANPPAKAPLKLERMPYGRARQIILGYGWKPVPPQACPRFREAALCARFPEVGDCSGVMPGYCGMVFARGNRCHYVVTRGGEPDLDGEGDTHVDHLSFRSGPCVND